MSSMEARRRGIPYHYDVLRVLKAGFDELSHGVVRANRYEMFRAVVEDAIDELGDRLPQFQERYFFVRTPEGDFYDVEALRGYLGMALAVLQRGLSQEFSAFDIAMMKLAIEEARKCVSEDTRVHPRVGVVVTKGQTLLASAYRGQKSPGEHAEYTVLEQMLSDVAVAGATIYTTLDPCTTRNPPKIPCADRLIERKVARVNIGMLDPDRRIRGNGFMGLRAANIGVGVFPDHLMAEIEELNREFIRSVAAPPMPYAHQGKATPYSGSYVLVLFPEAREVFIDDHSQGNNLAASGRPRALVVGAGVHTFRLGGHRTSSRQRRYSTSQTDQSLILSPLSSRKDDGRSEATERLGQALILLGGQCHRLLGARRPSREVTSRSDGAAGPRQGRGARRPAAGGRSC